MWNAMWSPAPHDSTSEGAKPSVLGQDAPASDHRIGKPRESAGAGLGGLGPDISVAIQACLPLGVSYLGWPSMSAHAGARWTRRQWSFTPATEFTSRGRDMAQPGVGPSQECSFYAGA